MTPRLMPLISRKQSRGKRVVIEESIKLLKCNGRTDGGVRLPNRSFVSSSHPLADICSSVSMLSAPAGGWRACSNTDRMQHGKVRFLRGKVRFVQREPPSEKGRGSRSSGSPCRACCEDVPVLCFEDGIIYRVECSALGERGIPLQLPQDRVAADWHAQPVVSKRQPGLPPARWPSRLTISEILLVRCA